MRVGKKAANVDDKVLEKSLYSIRYAMQKIKNSSIGPHVASLYLYGSCARHEQNHDSDVDLLLELKNNIDAGALRDEVIELRGMVTPPTLEYPEVDMKVVIGDNWKNNNMLYYKNIKREGIDIWNQD